MRFTFRFSWLRSIFRNRLIRCAHCLPKPSASSLILAAACVLDGNVHISCTVVHHQSRLLPFRPLRRNPALRMQIMAWPTSAPLDSRRPSTYAHHGLRVQRSGGLVSPHAHCRRFNIAAQYGSIVTQSHLSDLRAVNTGCIGCLGPYVQHTADRFVVRIHAQCGPVKTTHRCRTTFHRVRSTGCAYTKNGVHTATWISVDLRDFAYAQRGALGKFIP